MSGKTEAEKREGEVIWGGPAYYANRAWIVTTGGMVRITFGEQGGPEEPAAFRLAVALAPQDAVAFADVLDSVVKPIRDAIAKGQ